jgi:hypothetical protein
MPTTNPGIAAKGKLKRPTNPDVMNEEASQSKKKEAPPGPYKKAADDYVEYHATYRRERGTDIDGNVYLLPITKAYKRGYDNIKWDL